MSAMEYSEIQNRPLLSRHSSSSSSENLNNPRTSRITMRALTSIGYLIKLLPTGTVFMFQFLSPLLTNNGKCHYINRILSSILIGFCGFSCIISTFTDSYTDEDGYRRYGFATQTGIWPSSGKLDLSAYKLRIDDFAHAFFSASVFSVVALLDHNVIDCFYPSFESTGRTMLMTLPPLIGMTAATVFMVFPNTRHGIGYPNYSMAFGSSFY